MTLTSENKLPEMKKETSFSFCPVMENGINLENSIFFGFIIWYNTDLDNNTYVHNPKIMNQIVKRQFFGSSISVDEPNNESENTKNSNNGNTNNNAPNKLAVSELSCGKN